MADSDNEWRVNGWARKHATHGTFFVSVHFDGTAGASRVFGEPHEIEDMVPAGWFANAVLAMMACEKRIAELDKAMVDQTIADLRAYTARVSGA